MNVIGGNNTNRCWETTIAFLWPSHNIFIENATPYHMIVTANKQIARHDSIKDLFGKVLQEEEIRTNWKAEAWSLEWAGK